MIIEVEPLLVLAAALALGVYLAIALIHPEKF